MTTPRGLTLWPSLAGAVLAVAVGSLVFGGYCAARPDPWPLEPIAMVLAQWVFAAGCVYAANQAWIDRDRRQRLKIFGQCLAAAVPILLLMWIGAAYVWFALGGRT